MDGIKHARNAVAEMAVARNKCLRTGGILCWVWLTTIVISSCSLVYLAADYRRPFTEVEQGKAHTSG